MSNKNQESLTNCHCRAHKANKLGLTMLQAAVEKSEELGVPIVFALVDKHGNTILTYRMPDALLVSIGLAQKKAYTAVAFKMATHELNLAVQPGAELYQVESSSDGKVASFGGGFLVCDDDKIIGGIGISGGSVDVDMQIAKAALAAI